MRVLILLAALGILAVAAAPAGSAAWARSCTYIPPGPAQCVEVGTPGPGTCQQWYIPFPNPPGGDTNGVACVP